MKSTLDRINAVIDYRFNCNIVQQPKVDVCELMANLWRLDGKFNTVKKILYSPHCGGIITITWCKVSAPEDLRISVVHIYKTR